ncbi:hypothetical protein JCM19294_1941 [Nonlabens tegetincola]|uniref:Uncharacterized protein n=1 Tax=Nonlabens tegetincola TaxID=323273 RepID=A0A090Q3X1_9FLAO|nr:hypothetical protein JCM19294_1941 [Nonlabens tegetincola]
MKRSNYFVLFVTAIWLLLLAYLSFFTKVGLTTLLIVYTVGQGFLTAWFLPKYAKKKRCC